MRRHATEADARRWFEQVGVFHYVSRKHLHRYAAEAAFRWNERAGAVLENLALMVRFSRAPLAYGILVS